MQMARRTRWPGYTRDPNGGRRRAAGPGRPGPQRLAGSGTAPCRSPRLPGWAPYRCLLHDPGLHEDLAGRAGPDRVGDQLGGELVGRDDPQPGRRDPVADAGGIVVHVRDRQHRGRGGPVGEPDRAQPGVTRVAPACGPADPAAAEVHRRDPGMAAQGAGVPGQVGEVEVVVEGPGRGAAVGQPHNQPGRLAGRRAGRGGCRRGGGGGERGHRDKRRGAGDGSRAGQVPG